MHGKYRLQGFDYRSNRWYFLTVVTAGRSHLFGHIEGTNLIPSPLGEIVLEEIERLPQRRSGLEIVTSAVLPNHAHLLLGLHPSTSPDEETPTGFVAPAAGSVGAVVGAWKAGVVRRARQAGLWNEPELWQRRYHDRVVRNLDEWEAIADYILWNPVNWHLDPLSGAREPTDEEVRDWKRRLGM